MNAPTAPLQPPKRDRHLDALLAQVSAEHRPLFQDIYSNLPDAYVLKADGIALRGPSKTTPFCAPFRVAALAHRDDGTGWSAVVEIVDPDGQVVTCSLPWETLEGHPRKAMALLATHGLRLRSGAHSSNVLDLIRGWNATARYMEIDRPGWTEDRSGFALPTGRVLTRRGSSSFHYTGLKQGIVVGDLATWQAGVATLCQGNPNLIFACSLAFSGPLLAFSPSSASTIYHLYGTSSRGKTRILRAGLTVWPRIGQGDRTWRLTINGLEGEAAAANHLLLGLDDLPDDPPPEFGNAIYMIGNNGGKGRAAKDGTSMKRQTWKTAVLSTGEVASSTSLKKVGKTLRGGQGVRMVDIPVQGASGAFDNLHGFPSGSAFVAALDKAITASAGAAGIDFVNKLLLADRAKLERRIVTETEAATRLLLNELQITEDVSANEIRRVIDAFALVVAAGELATLLKVTPWQNGTATAAVVEIARRWLDARGNAMPRDQAEAIANTRDYLLRHGEKFQPLPVGGASAEISELLGYRNDEFYFVLPQTFADIHAGRSPDSIAAFLEDAGHLQRGGERGSMQYKMSGVGRIRPRVYRIRASIVDG